MINTYNESSLHKTLKLYFAEQYDAEMEVPFNKWIADIMTKDGSIIEIQTANLGALKEKALAAIKEKRNFTIVHPIVIEKKIENFTENGTLTSKRKSPKKENIYTVLEHLTGLYEILLSRYITLILVEVKTTEQRIQTKEKVQLKNKSRRYPKTWYKTGKELQEICKEYSFHGKKSYLTLLPALPAVFSSVELKSALSSKEYPSTAKKMANLILWLYSRMGLLKFIEKKERRNYYSL